MVVEDDPGVLNDVENVIGFGVDTFSNIWSTVVTGKPPVSRPVQTQQTVAAKNSQMLIIGVLVIAVIMVWRR